MLIKSDGGVHHPAADSIACPVLQYADGTLIVLKAATTDVLRLKQLLDQFAEATGLQINFHKSTVVPRNVDAEELPHLISILGCWQEQFPQKYLGMPLSNVKLNLNAFAPLIARADRYLVGWQASLLNAMGTTVLVNAVLDSALFYILSAMLLPQGTIDELDKRRRAFLWSGESSTSRCPMPDCLGACLCSQGTRRTWRQGPTDVQSVPRAEAPASPTSSW